MRPNISPGTAALPDPSEAESAHRRGARFDQRGIALQTVIIMVVLLAIAGGVAAVLLNRGSQASSQLEAQAVTTPAGNYSSKALCDAAGYNWRANLTGNQRCGYRGKAQCESAGGNASGNQTCVIAGTSYRRLNQP